MKLLPFLLGLLIALSSCNKDIDLKLPEYPPKLTVEFYLENGKPLRCLLQESVNYTDDRIINLVENALVTLSHNGIVDTLQNAFFLDSTFNKIYNYYNPTILKLQNDVEYKLYIRDKKGKEIFASTKYINPIKIDTAVFDFNNQNLARVGLKFFDEYSLTNFYRIVAFPTDTVADEESTFSFITTDDLFNGQPFSFFTGFRFERDQKVMTRLYSMPKDYYDFLQSVATARQSNFNPFGQPAPIISNINGGLGIFTALSYTEIELKIE